MIERIVVPVDFTPESDRALAIAPLLAEWAGASVELVSVVAPFDRAGVEAELALAAQRVGERTTWRCVESGGPVAAVLATELAPRQWTTTSSTAGTRRTPWPTTLLPL